MASIKSYYELTKSGLVFGNVITVIGGFVLGASVIGKPVDSLGLLAAIAGIFLVMASGCVFNNYIDRDIDGLMARTRDRAIVTGKVTSRAAFIFGIILGVAGFLVLALYTNLLATIIAALGFFFYVFMYSLWWKRRSVWGTLIGAISGATPPLVGYCAANNRFDAGAIILFFILVLWQMPHFYAIAMYRFSDYLAAEIPVLPVKKGIRATKITMLLFIIAFILVAPLLTIFGYAGNIYFVIALILGLAWLALCIRGFAISGATLDAQWARKMFFLSLIVLIALFITIAVGGVA